MSFRGNSRGRGGGGFGGGSSGGFRGRGGARGGFQQSYGPPDSVFEMGSFLHACEGEIVCESINTKIPYFNAPIYLENKTAIGKVDEILGPINQVYFTIKPQEGIVATSFKSGDKFYIGGDKLLPLEKFVAPAYDVKFLLMDIPDSCRSRSHLRANQNQNGPAGRLGVREEVLCVGVEVQPEALPGEGVEVGFHVEMVVAEEGSVQGEVLLEGGVDSLEAEAVDLAGEDEGESYLILTIIILTSLNTLIPAQAKNRFNPPPSPSMSRRTGIPNGEEREHPPAVADGGRSTGLWENVHQDAQPIDSFWNSSTGPKAAALIRYWSLFPD
ncbi:hypothetical protein FGG08_003221 [Glutinoglossum americanum]|uniref:H/ACA ribonucleoprotein complex subunit n=1 Tax=Glutinoglossum americanum TaxID=1670608 RepID=A0A9P8I4S5_9PEZI|nr:hypothetical protein FGG08_003221 [Glutinoglossum americanum]